MRTNPEHANSNEQREYLRGLLFADEEIRMKADLAPDPNLIDPFGTGNKHFWRGVIEEVGSVKMYPKRKPFHVEGQRRNPFMVLKAQHAVLAKFLAFLQEEIHVRHGIQWAWDDEGKLAWQARGGFLRVKDQQAQDIVRTLYLNCEVSKASYLVEADEIVVWQSKRKR